MTKSYTTPKLTLTVTGMADLLAAADRVVLSMKNISGEITLWQNANLTIEGETISWRMTEAQSADHVGGNEVEVTIYVDNDIFKTETVRVNIEKAVWTNGHQD